MVIFRHWPNLLFFTTGAIASDALGRETTGDRSCPSSASALLPAAIASIIFARG
jgi:hypothetical protein